MIRTTLLLLLVAYLSVYAWRNWFVSLCGAILLLAVVQHPDFPNSIGGIQGANPWNFLLLMVFLAASSERQQQGREWDMPACAGWMLLGYLFVVLSAAFRLMLEPPVAPDHTVMSIISEDLINCIKWVIPGLLLFDACRTRQRVLIALVVILLLYFLIALQVIKCMPLGSAVSGDALSARASKITQSNIGYNRVTLSMMLAGASWAMLALLPLAKRNIHKISLMAAAGIVALGQALTGGRTGYVTWAAVGLVLAVVRWRKLLPLIPAAVLLTVALLPAVRERMLQGLGGSRGNIAVQTDSYEMTSGRNLAWPRVIDKIQDSPLIGYGREGMSTTGIKEGLWEELQESFPHPHQAYFEILLDNGIIGFLLVVPFYLYCLRRSFQLLGDRIDALNAAVGGVSVALILALMIGAMGGQTFYPREGAVGMWAAIGLMLRVSVDWNWAKETGYPMYQEEECEQEMEFAPEWPANTYAANLN
jgi:O-antigen ligase